MFDKPTLKVYFNEFDYPEELRSLIDLYPIISTKKIDRDWWKKMKSSVKIFLSQNNPEFKTQSATLKYCPAIYDFINYGYTVPAWQDFQFYIDDQGEIECITPPSMPVKPHLAPADQIDTCPIMGDTASEVVKLVSPWLIDSPKGFSTIFCKPFYHYSNDFDVCPGILDTDVNETSNKIVNVFLRFNVKNKVIKIDAGQPLLQLIPFKRMNWTLSIEKPNEKLKKMFKMIRIWENSRVEGWKKNEKESLTKNRVQENKKFEEKCPR